MLWSNWQATLVFQGVFRKKYFQYMYIILYIYMYLCIILYCRCYICLFIFSSKESVENLIFIQIYVNMYFPFLCYLSKYMCLFIISLKESVKNCIFNLYVHTHVCLNMLYFDDEPYVFKSIFLNKVLFCSVLLKSLLWSSIVLGSFTSSINGEAGLFRQT